MTEDIADRIVKDIRASAPFAPYGTTPPRSAQDAYAIQDRVARALAAELGPVAGWKIAANTPALMGRFKLDEPATGRVFASLRRDSPAELRAADYRQFALEPEIAAIMGETLQGDGAPFTRDRVLAGIARFIPAMELLDMRETDMPNTHIPDAIAQNISNVGAVLGGPGCAPDGLDPGSIRTVLRIDGDVRHDVTGAAPQDPLDAVTWLANHLAARGLTLEAGQVVLCGTHSPIWYHEGSGEITVEMSGLGSVTLRLG
jgi:2-keto-4-pentenoate hydratase